MSNTTTPLYSDPDPESAKWLGILYAVYGAIGIPTNLLVLVLTVKVESLRTIPVNICIINIAFADMMLLISFLSSTIWALTYNPIVCKVMGVGVYIFIMMGLMLPSCLAICRYVGMCDQYELKPIVRLLKKQKGVIALNAVYWSYGLLVNIPFIIMDKYGLDEMGSCGLTKLEGVYLEIYYEITLIGAMVAAYGMTFIFYRKLGEYVKVTSSSMSLSPQTSETLLITRNLMRMIKWMLVVPIIFFYPALCVQVLANLGIFLIQFPRFGTHAVAASRIFPDSISVPTARIFMITAPLPHLINPFTTLMFIKRYRTALLNLLLNESTNAIHPFPPPLVYVTSGHEDGAI